MSDKARKPRAIGIERRPGRSAKAGPRQRKVDAAARKPHARSDLPALSEVPEDEAQRLVDDMELRPPERTSRAFSWMGLFLAAAGGLVALAVGLSIDQLVRELFARNDWLGWAALALAGLAALAVAAIALREIWGISRLNTIARVRARAEQAAASGDLARARGVVAELRSLYASRADLAAGRERLAGHHEDLIDGDDLLKVAERDLLGPLDTRARKMIMASARRVSVVTAVSPRALVDIAYVLMENLRLIRRLSQLYGGRPGVLGFWRLTRNILGHLAVTGSIAVGDSMLQQVIGHGLASRLSARLGEGVVNGLLTARIGIAAMDQCRPLAFVAQERPAVTGYFTELVRLTGTGRDEPSSERPAKST